MLSLCTRLLFFSALLHTPKVTCSRHIFSGARYMSPTIIPSVEESVTAFAQERQGFSAHTISTHLTNFNFTLFFSFESLNSTLFATSNLITSNHIRPKRAHSAQPFLPVHSRCSASPPDLCHCGGCWVPGLREENLIGSRIPS